jgi:hypothetical protein
LSPRSLSTPPRSRGLLAISFRFLADPHPAEFLGRFVLAVIGREGFFNLTGRDPHDVDGVADHIGGALDWLRREEIT